LSRSYVFPKDAIVEQTHRVFGREAKGTQQFLSSKREMQGVGAGDSPVAFANSSFRKKLRANA
jgi:hypothetical protein